MNASTPILSEEAPSDSVRSAAPLGMCVVLMTAPSDSVAATIGRTLVEEKLAACANIVSGVRSIYTWRGNVCDEAEVLCVMKTRRSLFDALEARIRSLHPYEVPEVVALDVANVSPPYREWVFASTARDPEVGGG